MPDSPCVIGSCRRSHYALGLCSMHYQRLRNNGDPSVRTERRTAGDWLLDIVLDAESGRSCIDWPFATSHGYGVVRIGGRNWPAHRVACELRHGRPPSERLYAAHNCGRSLCVNPHHLRWATAKENQADRLIHDTHNRGERQGASKLTEGAVREIRTLAGVTPQRELAARFGVTQGTVSDVVRRRSWGWL